MIRTQVYLPKDLSREIESAAKREGKPKAQVIRESIQRGLPKSKKTAGEALLELVELGKKMNIRSDDPHLSTNIDKYLYEEWEQK